MSHLTLNQTSDQMSKNNNICYGFFMQRIRHLFKSVLHLCIDLTVTCVNVGAQRLLQRQSSGCVYSSTHGFNQKEVREKLEAFPGGSIDLLKQDSGIAVLTINNPSRMNAFSGKVTNTLRMFSENKYINAIKLHCIQAYCFDQWSSAFLPGSMMVELEETVSQLENWTDGKGLIVHGAAGTFCSGSDLNAVRAISNPQVEQRNISLPVLIYFTFTLRSKSGKRHSKQNAVKNS